MFLNTSRTRVNKNNLSWWYILKTSWKYLCMSWRRLQHVLKTSSTRLEDIFARRLEDVLKTSSEDKDVRRLQDECLLVGFFLYTLKIFWKDQKIRGFFFYVFSFKANQSTGFHVTTTLVFKEWILIMAKYLTWVTA